MSDKIQFIAPVNMNQLGISQLANAQLDNDAATYYQAKRVITHNSDAEPGTLTEKLEEGSNISFSVTPSNKLKISANIPFSWDQPELTYYRHINANTPTFNTTYEYAVYNPHYYTNKQCVNSVENGVYLITFYALISSNITCADVFNTQLGIQAQMKIYRPNNLPPGYKYLDQDDISKESAIAACLAFTGGGTNTSVYYKLNRSLIYNINNIDYITIIFNGEYNKIYQIHKLEFNMIKIASTYNQCNLET